eukprot:COSAG03_NODE_1946_length_3315_cov_12.061878_5_plen_163_part_00
MGKRGDRCVRGDGQPQWGRHRSLRPSGNRPAQSAGSTHPPQTRRPHARCSPARRGVPRAVAAPSPAFLVSKSTAVDPVTTWVLRPGRDTHIGSLPGLWVMRRRRATRARATRARTAAAGASRRLTGGIRPYAPRHTQYDTRYEGIPRGKQGHTRTRCGHNVE